MRSINKKILARILSENNDLSQKEAQQIIDQLFDTITEALSSGNKVEISGFGKFEIHTRKPHKGIHPRTGEPMEIEASNVPAFRPSKTLRDAVKAHR